MVDESFTPVRKLYRRFAFARLTVTARDGLRRDPRIVDAHDPKHFFDRGQSLLDLRHRVVAQPLHAAAGGGRPQLELARPAADQRLQRGSQPEQLEDADASAITGLTACGASAPTRELAVRVEAELLDRRGRGLVPYAAVRTDEP